jgi:ParB family chromosome partitioning protein
LYGGFSLKGGAAMLSFLQKDNRSYKSGNIIYLPAEIIHPNPNQPRHVFDEASLMELAVSIGQVGVLQPLTVRKSSGEYELISGERRLRAARLAGLKSVPCITVDVGDEDSSLYALIENLQRTDLDYIEEAEGIAHLISSYGITQETAAQRLGKSQSAIANKLRILRHPPEILEKLRRYGLTERHARALLRIPDFGRRNEAIEYIKKYSLNVAQSEAFIDRLLESKSEKKKGSRNYVVKDIRIFINTLTHAIDTMRQSGIPANYDRDEEDDAIVLKIRIPKHY